MQMTIDGQTQQTSLLLDRNLMFNLLMELPEALGLQRIHGPVVIPRPDASGQPEGLCGYVIIAESHISIDTYLADRMTRASVFSCKDFNAEMVKRRLASVYKMTKVGWQIIPRTAGRYEEMVADS